MLDLNIMAVLICTREVLQDMKRRGMNEHHVCDRTKDSSVGVDDGQIVHISSLSGHRCPVGPMVPGVYAATKFAMRSLADITPKALPLPLNLMYQRVSE